MMATACPCRRIVWMSLDWRSALQPVLVLGDEKGEASVVGEGARLVKTKRPQRYRPTHRPIPHVPNTLFRTFAKQSTSDELMPFVFTCLFVQLGSEGSANSKEKNFGPGDHR